LYRNIHNRIKITGAKVREKSENCYASCAKEVKNPQKTDAQVVSNYKNKGDNPTIAINNVNKRNITRYGVLSNCKL
jgi:hypothetical protein